MLFNNINRYEIIQNLFLLYKKSQTNNRNKYELTSDIFIFALRVTKIKNDETFEFNLQIYQLYKIATKIIFIPLKNYQVKFKNVK